MALLCMIYAWAFCLVTVVSILNLTTFSSHFIPYHHPHPSYFAFGTSEVSAHAVAYGPSHPHGFLVGTGLDLVSCSEGSFADTI